MDSSSCSDSPLAALVLSEEQASERYREASRQLRRLTGEFEALRRLVVRFPGRVDYRAAAKAAQTRYIEAAARADLAWQVWQRAQHATDRHWTNTAGRLRGCRAA